MIACVITFIVTLITTVTITFTVVYIFVKNKFVSAAEDTTSKQQQQQQPAVTTDTVIYDTVGPPSRTSDKADMEIVNPAYTENHKVAMDSNPAYKSCK